MNISTLKRYLSNLPGAIVDRKILIIESDDWGSIRMPSVAVYKKMVCSGLVVENERYNRNDTLASKEDLDRLFDLLNGYSDNRGNPCVFTVVGLVANPDFEKIKESDFESYHWEPFTKTLERYYGDGSVFQKWKEGIKNRLFIPQFHGREHLNVSEWMRNLRDAEPDTRFAFEHGLWGFDRKPDGRGNIQYQAAYDFRDIEDLKVQEEAIAQGLQLFESLFGYRATFFVPPNGPFSNSLEKVAADNGIKYMSASKIQTEPLGNGKTRKVYHKLGGKNRYGQLYLTRNCFFEPNQEGKDWLNTCLKEIEIAFRMKKPAVISSHRTNYIGALNVNNRDNSLNMLKSLLDTVTEKWPETEFMTSDKLGDLLSEK